MAEAALLWPGALVGIMLPAGLALNTPGSVLHPWGRWSDPDTLAHGLYAGLRALDAQGCTVILCPMPPLDGIGVAIRDRLEKAARASGSRS
jgi:L-threonylcarbamoyladenylate synthase